MAGESRVGNVRSQRLVLPDGGFPNIHGKLPVKMIGEGPPGSIKRQKRGDGKAPA